MTQATVCPPPHVLERFSLGHLSEAEALGVDAHLESCHLCVRVLDSFRPDDPLLRAVQSAARSHDTPDLAALASPGLLQRVLRGLDQDAPADWRELLTPPRGPGEVGWFGPYRVLELLGHGGMGFVFRAEDGGLKRTVALKVIRPDAAARPGARARFLREARAAAGLQNEHVVTVYHVGEVNGTPFLTMPCLEGESLDKYLARGGPAGVPEVLRIGRHVALGLAAAHTRGLIHRDIKPGNLWLEAGTGRVLVLDFGLARPVAGDAQLTASGVIVGTPAFMAPEQARGEPVDARADLFSLGVVLYRLATGQAPFPEQPTPVALAAVQRDTPAHAALVNPNLPAELADLVMQLLAKDPADRPASAAAVAERLKELGEARTVELPPVAAPDEERPRPALPRRARRRWLVAGAAGVLAALLALWYFIGPQIVHYLIAPPEIIVGGATKPREEPKVKVPEDKAPAADKPGKPPEPRPVEEAHREAALGALKVRGEAVTVRVVGKKETFQVGKVKDLPAEPFHLVESLYLGVPQVDDEFLKRHHQGLTHVKELNLYQAKVTDAGLIHLKDLKQLKKLNLCWTRVTDRGLEHLAGFSRLTDLALCCTGIGDKGLERLAGLDELTDLHLGVTGVTDAGLEHLQHLKKLKKLDLSKTKVSGHGLLRLKDLSQLTYLVISDTQVGGGGLLFLDKLGQLQQLDLGGTKVGNTDLDALKPLKNLGFLSLRGTLVEDAGLARLGGLKTLVQLLLGNTKVSDDGLKRLKGLANLQALELSDTQVGDDGLTHLSGLTALRFLDLTNTRVTEAGVAAFRKQLPLCTVVTKAPG